MKNQFVFSATVLLIAFLCSGGCIGEHAGTQAKLSTYDRVMKSGVIRAGYFLYPPYCMKDPNTGKLTGIFVEALEQAAKNLSLKVDWKEEVGAGSMIEGLRSNRYDIVPTGVWPSAFRGREADFSIPLCYTGLGVWVRKDDNRFKNDLAKIDDQAISIATIDGQVTDPIVKNRFPHARKISHSELTDSSQTLLDVVHKKADLTLAEPALGLLFLKNNPGSLNEITAGKPIAIFGPTMMFNLDQPAFKSMLDTALTELLNTGYIDSLIAKYEPTPGSYYRVAKPYECTK